MISQLFSNHTRDKSLRSNNSYLRAVRVILGRAVPLHNLVNIKTEPDPELAELQVPIDSAILTR